MQKPNLLTGAIVRLVSSITILTLSFCYTAPTLAQTWPHSTTVGLTTNGTGGSTVGTFRLWLPSTSLPKALVFISNRGPMSQQLATDTTLRRLATQYQFGILMSEGGPIITGFEGGAAGQGGDYHHGDSIQTALNKLASLAGIVGVNHLPLVTFGHSLGVFFSQGMGLWSAGLRANNQPEMVAGIISYHLGNATLSNFAWANNNQLNNFKYLPNLWMNAELEGPDANNGSNLTYFSPQGRTETFNRRQSGELVHQTILKNGNHSVYTYKDMELMAMFISKVVQYKVPQGHDFSQGRPVLNLIDETQSYLGRSSVYNNFLDSNYVVGPYQNLNPATHWFLFDQDYSDAWKAYHVTDLYATSTVTTACVGERITVNYDNLSQRPFGPNNRFIVQLSSIISNYESPSQYPKVLASFASQAQQGSLTFNLPDNIIAPSASTGPLQPLIAGAASGMYRIRVITTDPYSESNNIGNIDIRPDVNNCPEPDFYVQGIRSVVAPLYNNILCIGRDTAFPLTLIRRNSFSFNAGNAFSIELSDSVGNFANPIIVGGKSSILPTVTNTNWSRDTVLVRIPTSTLAVGYGYKLRAVSTSPSATSSTNGSDIIIRVCGQPWLVTSTPAESNALVSQPQLYPNPSQGGFQVKTASFAGKSAQLTLMDQIGKTVWSVNYATLNESISIPDLDLTTGIYHLMISNQERTFRTKVNIQR